MSFFDRVRQAAAASADEGLPELSSQIDHALALPVGGAILMALRKAFEDALEGSGLSPSLRGRLEDLRQEIAGVLPAPRDPGEVPILTRTELEVVLEEALSRTERYASLEGVAAKLAGHLLGQLRLLKEGTAKGRSPTAEERMRLTFHQASAPVFIELDPELAAMVRAIAAYVGLRMTKS